MQNIEYLLTLVFFLGVSIFLERYFRLSLYRNMRERLIVSIFFFVVAITWDYIATLRGHWSFDGAHTTGIFIGVLPIEEYLFAFVVPYFVITGYVLLTKRILT